MKSVTTALTLLRSFATQPGAVSVGEISARLGYSKSHVSKLLASMRDAGFLQQDPATRRYSPGIEAFALGIRYVRDNVLARAALAPMRRVTEETGCSSALSLLHGSDVIHIQIVEGRLMLESRLRIGTWIPFNASSAGRVLLSRHPREAVLAMIEARPLRHITSMTLTSPEALLSVLGTVRQQGYALTRMQTTDGAAALAVPVFNERQEICAALVLLLPEHVTDDLAVTELLPALRNAARETSLSIGAAEYPYPPV